MSAIINSLRAMVQTAPDRWEARLALVEALLNEGSRDEAAQVLQQVTELPEELAERVLAGRAYGLLDPEIGLEVVEQVLQIDPTHAAAHFEKAKLCHLKNDLENAQKHYFTAITFDGTLTDPSFASLLTGTVSQPSVVLPETHEPEQSQTALPVTNIATQNEVASPPVDRDQVYYPDPGEYPTIPLSEALAVTNIQPLIHADAIPDQPELAYQEDVQYVETEHSDQQQYWEQLNNVEVHTALQPTPMTYDYQAPDDSIFDPTITPDDIYVGALVTETGEPVANLQESIRRNKAQKDAEIAQREKVAKIQSVGVALITLAAICFLMVLVVVASPRPAPPQIVASAPVALPDNSLEEARMIKQNKTTPIPPQSSSLSSMEVITVASASDISIMSFDSPDLGAPSLDMDFGSSMSFGEASMSFFGSKTKGELAVVFDITNSMREALPLVVSEIKRGFKNAQVVCVFGGSFERDDSTTLVPYKRNRQVLAIVDHYADKNTAEMNRNLFSLKRSVSLEVKGKLEFKRQRQSIGTGIEALLRQQQAPGTIFVFSDFEDGFSAEYMKEIKSLARRKNTKIVFWYPFDQKRPKWLPVREHYLDFAKSTKGELKEETIKVEK